MRTVTTETAIYTLQEVTENKELLKKVLDNYRNINTDYDWHEYVIESETEKLKALGYSDVEINFSGFWSQGDGASFTAKIDVHKWIEQNNPIKYRRILSLLNAEFIEVDTAKVYRTTHFYSHENTTKAEVYFNMFGNLGTGAVNVSNLLDKIESEIETQRYNLSKEIYATLEKEYYFLQTDEQIIESLECNEYEFTENGKIA